MKYKSLSIFTSMTNPEKRNDPWKEALDCYESLADEVIVVGEDWPEEFSWEEIGNTFQSGFDKATSDWVIRMDIDYFFHEKDFKILRESLNKFDQFPVLAFPQYQFFLPNKYQIKTRLCLAFNKKLFPNIKLNGGGDLTLATLNNQLLQPKLVPNINTPIFQYDSLFRTKKIISEDRARFARAWGKYFGSYGDRGGPSTEEAYLAWKNMVIERFPKHTFNMPIPKHPKFIKDRLLNINPDQFGYNLFGLSEIIDQNRIYFYKGLKEKYINPFFLYKYKHINTYKNLDKEGK